MSQQSQQTKIQRIDSNQQQDDVDFVAVEEPLEIRIEGCPTAVLMRTPGHDLELVAGFLVTEGVIDGDDDIHAMKHVDDPADPQGNTVDVILSSGVPNIRRERANREFYASSSCGVCGKASIDKIFLHTSPFSGFQSISTDILLQLPSKLRQAQPVFQQTGGLHAAALFDKTGNLYVLREDIGRHNAVDKVIGHCLLENKEQIEESILLVSGRVGFDIVQKALLARIPMIAAIGAPSTLAVQAAQKARLSLIGFLRNGRYNLYTGDACW